MACVPARRSAATSSLISASATVWSSTLWTGSNDSPPSVERKSAASSSSVGRSIVVARDAGASGDGEIAGYTVVFDGDHIREGVGTLVGAAVGCAIYVGSELVR